MLKGNKLHFYRMPSYHVFKAGSEGQFGGKEKSQVTCVHFLCLKTEEKQKKLLLIHKTQNYIEKKLSKTFCIKKRK